MVEFRLKSHPDSKSVVRSMKSNQTEQKSMEFVQIGEDDLFRMRNGQESAAAVS